jgi:Leucine-rich repeat (LRR) protein
MTDIITINGINYDSNTTFLNLSDIGLTELPKEIYNFSKLVKLELCFNNLTEIPKEIYNLTNLIDLDLSCNDLTVIQPEICNLKNLLYFSISNNKLTELPKEICNLTRLESLSVSFNNLTELPIEIANLNNLRCLDLYKNELTQLSKEICNLRQLNTLFIGNNKLTELPLEIINLRALSAFNYINNPLENLLNPIINRFIFYINNKPDDNTIYDDQQNVHLSSIQQSIKDSILNLMKNYNSDYELNYLNNPILTPKTKESLVEYSNFPDVHMILNITFEELLKAVFIEIDTFMSEDYKSILEILNQEMDDSMCMCFTGRISRLVNCLNGFSDKVYIKIGTNEEISNIIIVLRNKIFDLDELKKAIDNEMTERGYTRTVIEEWLQYVE